jgi:heme a synthase
MADRWIPTDLLSFEPLWKNVFENPTTVQFNHRVLAISTYTAILFMTLWSRRFPLSPQVRNACHLVAGIGTAQVALGISTLLWFVPISVASLHQAGSLALLTSASYLLHVLKRVRSLNGVVHVVKKIK